MAPPKPSTRRRTIAVCLAVLVALLVLVPWGWRLYQNSRSVEAQIREAIDELAYHGNAVSAPRSEVARTLERLLNELTGRKTERERKRNAENKLFEFGAQAFPFLAESFDDDRPSFDTALVSNPK